MRILAITALALVGCSGDKDGKPRDRTNNKDFVEVGVGWSFSCGLKEDRSMLCWGTAISDEEPSPDARAAVMAVGYDGVCWVEEGTQALGCAGLDVPVPLPTGAFSAVGIGRSAACALDTAGELTCWSLEDELDTAPLGQLPAGPFSALSVGAGHGLALRPDGTLAVFGAYAGTPPGGTFERISTGYREACAIGTDASVACWADDDDYSYVAETPDGGSWQDVGAGYGHSCAVADDGAVSCWGSDTAGQSDAPSGTFVDVAAGGDYSCAVADDGVIACWGDETYQGSPDDL